MEAGTQDTGETSDPIEALIRGGRHRDALLQSVREHGEALGRTCMALLGSQDEAEEAVQETFIAAHDAMEDLPDGASVRAWLFGIARRMCARRLEARKRRPGVPAAGEPATGQSEDDSARERKESERRGPDDEGAERPSARQVRRAIAELKPSERDVVVLRYQAGLGYGEIAQACGVDEAEACKRASRALDRLRLLMQDEVG